MPDNSIDHEQIVNNTESQADHLHGVVQAKLQIPSKDWKSDDHSHIQQLANHPNVNTDHLSKIYSHLMPQPEQPTEGGETVRGYNTRDSLKAIFNSPKASSSDAEDFLKRTWKNHDDYDIREAHKAASKVGGVPQDTLKGIIDRGLQDPEVDEVPAYKLPASFYHNIYATRPQFEPEEGQLNAEQAANNKKAKKLDKLFLNAISKADHSPEELEKTVELLTGGTPFGVDKGDTFDAAKSLVKNNDKLSSAQIEHIFETWKDHKRSYYSGNDMDEVVFKNKNISPDYVSKVALSTEGYEDEVKKSALRSPNLPQETIDRFIESYDKENPTYIGGRWGGSVLTNIAQNPDVKPENLEKIYSVGNSSDQKVVVGRDNAPQHLIEDFWTKQDKKTDSSRYMLTSVPNVPPSVLADIVGKGKNQEVSLEALKHPNVDISVVEAGLKRKAQKVQEAASRHPLVAKRQLTERLSDGRLSPQDFLFDDKTRNAAGEITPEQVSILDSMYKDKPHDSYEKGDYKVKRWLATDPSVDPEIRSAHKSDLLTSFTNNISPTDYARGDRWNRSNPSNLAYQVLSMAEQGDLDAQEAVLSKDGVFKDVDFKSKGLSGQFLAKSYEKLGAMYGNSEDRDEVREMHRQRRWIISNPSCDQDTFDKHTLNHDFYDSHNSAMSENYSSWGADKNSIITVFDDRYMDASDEEKNEGFDKLLDLGHPMANYAVALSNSAPKDKFNKAFDRLDDSDKFKALTNSRKEYKFRDVKDSTYTDMIWGRHNTQTRSGDTLQQKAIEHIDLTNPMHMAALTNMIDHVWSQDDPQGHASYISPDKIYSAVTNKKAFDKDFVETNEFNHLLDTSMRVNDKLGVKLALNKAKLTSENTQDRVDKIREYFESTSAGDQQRVRDKWHIAISSGLKAEDKESGALDFLYDLPGDADDDYLVRNEGLRRGIFSERVQMRAALESPEALSNTIRGISGVTKRNEFIRDALNNQGISKDYAKAAIEYMDATTFMHNDNYKWGKEKVTDAQFDHAVGTMHGIIDSLVASGHHDLIPNVAEKVTRSKGGSNRRRSSSDDVKFTKAHTKKMIGEIGDKVDSIDSLTDAQKGKIKYNIWSEFEGDRMEDLVPASIMKGAAEAIVAGGDVDTMLDMIDRMDKPPAAVQKAVAGYLKKPDALDTDQMLSLSNMAKADNSTIPTIKSIFSALEKRAAADPERASEINQKALYLAGDMVKGVDEKKSILGFKAVNKQLTSTDPEIKAQAHKVAGESLKYANVPMEDRVKTFMNMESDLGDSAISITDSLAKAQYPQGLLNDPDVILSATHGWKLNAMIHNAENLKENAAAAVLARLKSDETFDAMHVGEFAEKLMRNDEVSDETTREAFDSLDPMAKYHVTSNLAKDYDFAKNGAWIGLGDSADYLENSWNEAVNMGGDVEANAYNRILINVAKLNRIFERSEDHNKDYEAAQEAMDDYMGRAADLGMKIQARMLSRIENSPEEIEAEEFNSYCRGMRAYRDSLIHSRNLGSHTMKGLSVALGMKDTMEAYIAKKGKNTAIDHSGWKDYDHFHEDYVDSIQSWTNMASCKDHEWGDVFKKAPEAQFMLDQRYEVPGAAIDAIDVAGISELGPMAMGNLLQSASQWGNKVHPDDHGKVLEFADKLKGKVDYQKDAAPLCRFYKNTAQSLGQKMPYGALKDVLDNVEEKYERDTLLFTAAAAGAGGNELLHRAVDYSLENNFKGFSDFAKTAKLDEAAISKIMPAIFETEDRYKKETYLKTIVSNESLESNSLRKIKAEAENTDSNTKFHIFKKLQEHPQIDFNTFNELYEDTKHKYGDHIFRAGEGFNPAFKNRVWGGKLFREQPVEIPKEQPETVERSPEKLIFKTEHSKDKQALRDVAAIIPPEGIRYGDFKKLNKALAENNAVKETFMNSKGQFVLPEDLARAIELQGGDYHITYSTWDGPQRHMGSSRSEFKNLVIQLNTGEHMEKQLAEDPKLWKFFQMVQTAANRTQGDQIGGHPVTPHNAAWVRIDHSGGKEGWVIEELQSDFGASLRRQINDIEKKHPDGLTLEGEFYHPSELKEHAKKVEKILSGWHEAAMKGTIELAKRQGVKNLYLHGEGVRSYMSFGNYDKGRANPVWMQHMYTKWPKKNGWEKCDYTDYPNHNENTLNAAKQKKEGSQCWRLKLS